MGGGSVVGVLTGSSAVLVAVPSPPPWADSPVTSAAVAPGVGAVAVAWELEFSAGAVGGALVDVAAPQASMPSSIKLPNNQIHRRRGFRRIELVTFLPKVASRQAILLSLR